MIFQYRGESMYESDHKVFAAYRKQFGINVDLPSYDIEYFIKNEKEYARLRNMHGTLAVYEVSKDGSIKFDEKETAKK